MHINETWGLELGYVVFPIWQENGDPSEVHDGEKTMKKSQKVKKNDSRENSVQRKINSMS
jgi:hypothetical protein